MTLFKSKATRAREEYDAGYAYIASELLRGTADPAMLRIELSERCSFGFYEKGMEDAITKGERIEARLRAVSLIDSACGTSWLPALAKYIKETRE